MYALVKLDPYVRPGIGVVLSGFGGRSNVSMSSAVCRRYVSAVTFGNLIVFGNHSIVGEFRVALVEGM